MRRSEREELERRSFLCLTYEGDLRHGSHDSRARTDLLVTRLRWALRSAPVLTSFLRQRSEKLSLRPPGLVRQHYVPSTCSAGSFNPQRSKIMKSNLLNLVCLLAALAGARAGTVIPPEFAMPAGSVDTSMSGFLVRPYQTAAAQPNSLAWTEDQLLGLHGPNLADLTGADANGYYTVGTVVNWNIHVGTSVDGFQAADPF